MESMSKNMVRMRVLAQAQSKVFPMYNQPTPGTPHPDNHWTEFTPEPPGPTERPEPTMSPDVNDHYELDEESQSASHPRVRMTGYNMFPIYAGHSCKPYKTEKEKCHGKTWEECIALAVADCNTDENCAFVASATAGYAAHGKLLREYDPDGFVHNKYHVEEGSTHIVEPLPEPYSDDLYPDVDPRPGGTPPGCDPKVEDCSPFRSTRHCYQKSGQTYDGPWDEGENGPRPPEETNVMDRYGYQKYDCSPTLENNCTWDMHMKLCNENDLPQTHRCLCVTGEWGQFYYEDPDEVGRDAKFPKFTIDMKDTRDEEDLRHKGDVNGYRFPVCGVGEKCNYQKPADWFDNNDTAFKGVGVCSSGPCAAMSNDEEGCDANTACKWKRRRATQFKCMNRPYQNGVNLFLSTDVDVPSDLNPPGPWNDPSKPTVDIELDDLGMTLRCTTKKDFGSCTNSAEYPAGATNVLGQNGCLWTPNAGATEVHTDGECTLYGCSTFKKKTDCEKKYNRGPLTAMVLRLTPCMWKEVTELSSVCEVRSEHDVQEVEEVD